MKKITLFLLASCFAISTINAQDDKAFHKGVINADLGIGFAIYGTKIHSEIDQQVWNGSAIVTQREVKDTTDGAASTIYVLNGEYGVTDWLGVGVRFGYSNYFEQTEHDTILGTAYAYKPKVRSIDFGVNVNFHLVKTKRFDMPICLTMGYSNFKYWQNNPNSNPPGLADNGNAMGKDNGLNYGIMLVPRIYFGDHVGMFFNIGYMGYNYPSIAFSNNSDSDLNNDDNWEYKLKGNGFNLGIGITAKF
ncbi:MAG: hypothetical protein IPP64_06950 [Bacteroidetes bacterium]|nr:hypothetical protein [Bacteroidota bacterium]